MNTRRYALPLSVCFLVFAIGFAGCEKHEDAKPSGTSTSSSPEEKTPIQLGATLPLSGDVASYGKKAMNGIQLAADQINDKGGVLGRPIKIEWQDDRNDSKEAVNIVTRFCTVDKVPVIFGSAGSTVSLAIAPIANRHEVVLITPVSSSAQLSTDGGKFFFRTVPADDVQADVLTNWVHEFGAKRVAIVYTNNSWGKPLGDGFKSKFEKLGGEVLLSEGVAENTTDFRTIIAKVKELQNLDAVVSPTYPKEGATFVRQVRELGLKKPLFGGDNWGSPEFRNVAGDSANGVFYTGPAEITTPQYEQFAKDYKAKFNEEPDILGAYAYDAAMAVFKAIEACQCTDGPGIREALLKVSFIGASGDIAFKSNGDVKSQAFARFTVENGQPQSVSGSGE